MVVWATDTPGRRPRGQRVGGKELRFLVNSGTYFGFLLGVVQMGFWMVYPAHGLP